MLKVAHSVVEMLVNLADRCEIPLEEVARGLPVDVPRLRRLVGGLEWEYFIEMLERIEARVGYERLEAICAHVPDIAPVSQRMLANFVSARMLIRFVCRLFGPNQYPMFDCGYEESTNDAGELIGHVRMRLRPGFRENHTIFRLMAPAQASIPCFLGLPPTRAVGVATPRGTDIDLLLPPSNTLFARASRGFKPAPTWNVTLRQLEEDNARLLEAHQVLWRQKDTVFRVKLSEAEARWALTERQVQVVSLLARGLSNKELGKELGCSVKTVETHVTEVLRRAGAASRLTLVATFWKDL
ncbi:MAG: helix-turn-helix transcriptional regulator [Myxococcota bacterium]